MLWTTDIGIDCMLVNLTGHAVHEEDVYVVM